MSASNRSLWHLKHASAANSAMFCPDCQSLLDLPDADLIMRCPLCHYQVTFQASDVSNLDRLSVSTKYSRAKATADAEEDNEKQLETQRATVQERCPKCNHHEMSFWTMQMRSVDEGQTVFFECKKCGHTFSTNT